MNIVETYISPAWEKAEKDLNLDIEVPFTVKLNNNIEFSAAFLVRNFGAKNGMLIIRDGNQVSECGNQLHESGYGYCVMRKPKIEGEYNRIAFVDMLSDWGWTGPSNEKPSWIFD
jgi:hypothetical protein